MTSEWAILLNKLLVVVVLQWGAYSSKSGVNYAHNGLSMQLNEPSSQSYDPLNLTVGIKARLVSSKKRKERQGIVPTSQPDSAVVVY